MTLSFCVLTKNSAAYIEKLLRSARSFADEIVVAVDSSSTDSTEKVCSRYADKLFRVEPVGSLAYGLAWLQQQCEGDWILRLDDDELPSERLVAILPRLIRDKEITHYWMRRRWIFGAEGKRWIDHHPWWPDWQMRLHRNISSIVHVPAIVHTRTMVWGGSRYVYEGSIYHLDLVYHSEEHRRRKVEQGYERRTAGKGLLHYYVPEETSPTTTPIPKDDGPLLIPRPAADWRERLVGRASRGPLGASTRAKEVTFSEIHRASMQEYEQGPQLFKAHLRCDDCPRVVTAGEWYPVDVEVRNDSPFVWTLLGLGAPAVRVGYHWVHVDGEMHVFDTHRDFLPHAVWPGESVRMPVSLLAPEEPNEYILRWDLVIENVAWFSSHGWQGPEEKVRVE